VATLTGNPQNMLVGSFSTLTYRGFLLTLLLGWLILIIVPV